MTNLELILAGAELLSKANENMDDGIRLWMSEKQVHVLRLEQFKELAGDRESMIEDFNEDYDQMACNIAGWKFFTLINKDYNEA